MTDHASRDEALAGLESRGLQGALDAARREGGGAEDRLLHDVAGIHWTTLDRQLAALGAGAPAAAGALEPPPLAPPSTAPGAETEAAVARGMEAIRAGRVALATVAGGQASRLGFDGPKGAYPIGPVSGASLFQIMAGMVHRLRERSGAALPWIIQTGPENHEATQEFFTRRSHFGLPAAGIHFVCQGTLPALSPDGKLLLSAPDRLFRNPDGHGGFYRALAEGGLFEALSREGIDTLFYCQVDNPLVRMGDPAFLGHHLLADARMSVKVVEKTEPAEKVGLVVHRDGRATCIEYSDLDEELARERESDGKLRFRAGNIAIHAFALDFARRMADADLPLHLARKKVQALDGGAFAVERDGVKFETFVFDALPLAERTVVQMCERSEEFSPVKNRAGQDSIATSRASLDRRNRAWCRTAFPDLPLPADSALELEPGLALDADDLRSREQELELRCGGHLLASRH